MASVNEIVGHLNSKIDALVREILPGGKDEGGEWVVCNPNRVDGRPGSFKIAMRGSKAGQWSDFALGISGDALALIAYIKTDDFSDPKKKKAIAWAKKWLGSDVATQPKTGTALSNHEARKKGRPDNKNRAIQIFNQAEEDVLGTPVDLYLKHRGIDLASIMAHGAAPFLRFHPACPYGKGAELPAMIAGFVHAGELIAIHRTFLANCGTHWQKAEIDQPRMMLGSTNFETKDGKRVQATMPIWSPNSEPAASPRLALTEGIEDALSLAILFPGFEIHAVGSVNGFKSIRPVKPEGKGRRILLCADNDVTPEISAIPDEAASILTQLGHSVHVFRVPRSLGKDLNEALMCSDPATSPKKGKEK